MALIDKSEGRFEASSVCWVACWKQTGYAERLGLAGNCAQYDSSDSLCKKRRRKSPPADIPPIEEAELRFAIGKYHDDLGNFSRAFESY